MPIYRKQLCCILFFILICGSPAYGWDYSKCIIPLSEILDGGPPKDGIPALTGPKFISGQEAKYLKQEERVLGIFLNKEAKAYPIRILNWHEIVNDVVGTQHVVITYCPLTGSGIAFDSKINNRQIKFGVSGKLYNSNLLLYDHFTESLWSQLKMEAVTGKMTGVRLKPVPILNTTWQDWKRRYPNTKVLSLDTGYRRNYSHDPYQGYQDNSRIYFPLSSIIKRTLSKKEWVLGVIINGKAKAYPFSALDKISSPLSDKLGGKKILVHFDKKERSGWIESQDGKSIPSMQIFWFAWFIFYPETEIFLADK